jgi:hypothetical protein
MMRLGENCVSKKRSSRVAPVIEPLVAPVARNEVVRASDGEPRRTRAQTRLKAEAHRRSVDTEGLDERKLEKK